MEAPTYARLADGLRQVTADFGDIVTGADPQSPVPTCPDWTLRNLTGHIGQSHRWAAEIVRTGTTAAPPDPRDAEPGPSSDWSGWLAEGARELIDAVGATGADRTVSSLVGARPAEFWLRRMLHDTSVHLFDAAVARAGVSAMADDLAVDAVSEGLDLVTDPATAALNPRLTALRGQGETLQFRLPDSEQSGWLVTRGADRVRWRRETADADVVVTGEAEHLVLMMWRRLSVDDPRITIEGDRSLIDHWLAVTH